MNRKRNHEQDLCKLKQHIANKKSWEETARVMQCSTAYLRTLKEESIQNGTWFTDEELQSFRIKKEGKRKKERRDKSNSNIEQEINQLRDYFFLYGNNLEEIANLTPYTVRYLKKLIKVAINRGMWFSEEEEKDILERTKRETETKAKAKAEAEKKRKEELEQTLVEERIRKKEEQARVIEKYLRTREDLGETKTQMQEEPKQGPKGTRKPTDPKIQRDPLFEEYEQRRKVAKREDKLEMNGRENVSTEGRIRFVDILAKLQSLDMQISNDDIEIILNGYDMHPEIANTKGIRVLINDANQKDGIYGTEKRVNELIGALKRTRFHQPLLKYRSYLRKLSLLPKINEMRQEGLEISTIAKGLGLSLKEINDILNSDEKKEFSAPDDMDM